MLLLLTGCSHVTSEMKESRENGIALMESGDYEGAVAEFDSLIDQTTRVTSFEIDVLKYRGEAEFMLGDYGAAAYTYDTLAKVDKPRAEYYYLGAVSLANSGDQDGAENRLESGKSADAKHEVTGYAEAMEALGAAYMTAGDEEKADELYQTLVDEGFSSTEVYNRWMMAAMEKGNYEEALQHAEAGLASRDDRAKKEIAFNQAVCYGARIDRQQYVPGCFPFPGVNLDHTTIQVSIFCRRHSGDDFHRFNICNSDIPGIHSAHIAKRTIVSNTNSIHFYGCSKCGIAGC